MPRRRSTEEPKEGPTEGLEVSKVVEHRVSVHVDGVGLRQLLSAGLWNRLAEEFPSLTARIIMLEPSPQVSLMLQDRSMFRQPRLMIQADQDSPDLAKLVGIIRELGASKR